MCIIFSFDNDWFDQINILVKILIITELICKEINLQTSVL